MSPGKRRRVLLVGLITALVVVAAAMASGSAVPVTLKLTGSTDRTVGQLVRLTATARVPAGDRLLILGTRTGKPNVKVAECLRSPCSGTFRDRTVEVVDFQASVIKRTGTKISTLGRSKKISVGWSEPAPPPAPPAPPIPPAPPPTPAATPGHYEGRTSQNEIFRFDITADGRGLVNLQTGQINESCTPGANLSGGNIGPVTVTLPVAFDGSFTISSNGPTSVGGSPGTDSIKITGHIASGIASGTIRDDTTFSEGGTTYTCSSGDQTWNASKT